MSVGVYHITQGICFGYGISHRIFKTDIRYYGMPHILTLESHRYGNTYRSVVGIRIGIGHIQSVYICS